jgi:opacity protein-like surface antigen
MNGGSGQISYNVNKWVSAVGDVGYYTMNPTPSKGLIGLTIHGTEVNYLLGPRLSYRHFQRFTPYAQILIGMFHDTETTFDDPFKSEFKLGYTAGGGVDFKIKSYLAFRPVAIDIQRTQFAEQGSFRQIQTNIRYSAGFVLRF